MSTAYYAHENPCPHCNKPEKRLHIGSKAGGWQFHFAAYFDEHLTDFTEWETFLMRDEVVVVDEYDCAVDKAAFFALVANSADERSHYDWCSVKPEYHAYMACIYKDQNGWTFSKDWFR